MRILVINQLGTSCIVNSDFVPRTGDRIDLFYEPLPTVASVIAWPSTERVEALGIKEKVDVIVTTR